MALETTWRKCFGRTLEEAIAAERWLCAIAEEARLTDPVQFALQLCLEELFTNIVRHGAPDGSADSGVCISIESAAGLLRMTVEDGGAEFDITQGEVHPITRSLQEVEPGGLGLLLIRTFSRTATYERKEGRNRVTLEFSR